MATVTVITNLNAVAGRIRSSFELLKDKEYLLRPLAIETIPLMKKRIHEKGQASDGSQIGTYSAGYMVVRTGNYKNATKKTAGAFKRGKNAFSIVATRKENLRPKYNRSSDTKVIISLTRQLENDYSVQATGKGYGIGFNNKLNKEKAWWVEETYNKIIFNLSKSEKEYINERLQELTDQAFNPK